MSRMIRFHKFGAAEVLRCEEQAEPSAAVGEVQIRVEAIGVSWYDVLWRQNLAPSQARLPAGIGHEMAGVVTAVGDGVDDIAVGDRVGIAWLRHTCGRCAYCLRGDENLARLSLG
jgi:D-arabinose 1-dehydrogenase-like Zn-dependent alcohol dehydrogenase